MKSVSADEVAKKFRYNPETGEFTWLITNRRIKAGAVTKGNLMRGYRYLTLSGNNVPCHRLAWVLTHGRWPNNQIDHINGVRDDNRLCNLREVTPRQNSMNTGPRGNRPYKGVTWDQATQKYRAGITFQGKDKKKRRIHLGLFHDPENAARAYDVAALRLFEDYARLNFPEAKDDYHHGPSYIDKWLPMKVEAPNLLQTMDARIWAKEFIRLRPSASDFSTMVTWFANALMCGYDFSQNRKAKP